jgi:hypothetical protein
LISAPVGVNAEGEDAQLDTRRQDVKLATFFDVVRRPEYFI